MTERIDVYIEKPNLDAQDILFDKLPDGIATCWSCRGNGKRKQRYCDAPAMTGRCDWCQASGFRYEETGKAVPASVVNQIAIAHDLHVQHYDMYGNNWTKP